MSVLRMVQLRVVHRGVPHEHCGSTLSGCRGWDTRVPAAISRGLGSRCTDGMREWGWRARRAPWSHRRKACAVLLKQRADMPCRYLQRCMRTAELECIDAARVNPQN